MTITDILPIAGPIITASLGAMVAVQRNGQRRVDTILKERQELYEENRQLRVDLRAELVRVTGSLIAAREEAHAWSETAAAWEARYNREVPALKEKIDLLEERLEALIGSKG
jgi:hypothetical protein